ncbi:MAG: hypothetical protein NTY53_07145, partial [Kiritimatiellaeota bacterium]|nr:hypothetical protein [Kiritimatiellota bacterium]
DQAYSKLDAAGLVADSVYLDDTPPTPKQVGTVKSQAPVATTTNPNTRTQAGDVVHLEIYGKVVPSLLNWHQNKFDLILKPVGMSVDSTTVDKLAPREDLELCAYGQSPAPGSLVPRNKKMSVKLYRPRDSNANYPGKTAPVAAPTRKGKKPGDEFIGEWKMISIHQYLPLPEKEISAQGSIDKCDRMGTAGLYWQLEGCGFGGGDMNPEDGSTYATRHGVKTWGEKWCFSIEPGHARYEGRQPEIDTQNNLGKKLTYRRVVKYRRVGTGSGSSKDGLAGIDSGVAATGTQAGGTIDYPDMSLGRSFRSQDVVVAGDEMTVTYDETGYGRDSFVEVPIHQDAVGSWVDEGWDPWLVFHVDKNKKISGMFQRWQNQAHTGILDEQFIDLPSFVSKLKQPPDPVSRYLQSQLCNESLTYLRDMAPNNADLQRRLLFDLDGIVHRQPIYDAQRFAGVTLRPETQLLLAKFLGNESRATINKMLLEDAYPREISTNSSNFIVPFTGEAHTVGTSEKNKNTSFKIAGVLPAREKNGQPGTWELEEFFNQSDKRFDGKIHIHEIRNGKLETIKEYRTMHRFDGAK